MSENEKKQFEYDEKGRIIVDLRTGFNQNGTQIKIIAMREPTVNDQLVAEKMIKVSDAEREIKVFSNLCEISPDEVKSLTMRDFKKLQEAYLNFLTE